MHPDELALYEACVSNNVANVEKVSALLKKGVSPNKKDNTGRVPLHWAAESDNLALARVLLDYKAEIEAKNGSHRTPLHLAVYIAAIR